VRLEESLLSRWGRLDIGEMLLPEVVCGALGGKPFRKWLRLFLRWKDCS